MKYLISILLLVFLLPTSVLATTISPLDCGLRNARTGEERFNVLYRTHDLAKKNDWNITYKGIGEIKIEIPANAKSIPLGNETDFCNVILTVTNKKKKDFFLFELTQNTRPIKISKELLKTYDFRKVKELKQGYKILIVEDLNPWVDSRVGYNYGAIRKDILLLKNGKAINKTIAPYDNEFSNPSCAFVEVSNDLKYFKSITFERSKESLFKTFLVKVMNMNNVLLQEIEINTPSPTNLIGDDVIDISNCTNVSLKHVKFNQTYSSKKNYGYGIRMNNVWNSLFDYVEGEAAWGLFGNNNINKVSVNNCKINRFDTHCYGKDCYFTNCEFTQYGLPQSSFMGVLNFTSCIFKNAYMCFARTDYNAYSSFSIIVKDCVAYLDSRHRSLIHLGNLSKSINNRQELRKKFSPSISIFNSKIVLSEDIPSWYLIQVGSDSIVNPFDYIGDIIIEGLKVIGGYSNFMIFNRPIQCLNSVNISLKEIDLVSDKNFFLSLAKIKYDYTPTINFNINKDGKDIYYISDSRLNYSPLVFPHYNIHFSNCTLGRIRYYNTKHGKVSTRRRYENCIIYLNDIDTKNYTLDDNAYYNKCVFSPVDLSKKVLPYSMSKSSEILFQDCSSSVNSLFDSRVTKDNKILKLYKYKFK